MLVDQIGVFVLLAIGLNIVVGFAGLLDLGYIAFYAIGAYSAAYWTGTLPIAPPFHLNSFFAIPFAVLAAMFAGVVLGAPTLRLRGDYLAIVTLGFGEIIQIVATNLSGVTGGARGRDRHSTLLDPPSWHPLHLGGQFAPVLLPAPRLRGPHPCLVPFAFENSKVRTPAWTAIREDEVAAEASGINVLKYKVMAFSIGASTSGFAGILTASKISFVEPGDFTVQLSILVLVLVIFGGMGSLAGAVVGAAFLQCVPVVLARGPSALRVPARRDLYIYLGALLILMMIFRPIGIIASKRRRREIGLSEQGLGTADAMTDTAP